MKTIGLIGGMSWESTVSYYQIINRAVGERLGGLHSAKILLHSVDFAEIERLQHPDRWAEAGSLLAEAAMALEGAGADFLVICTNTMHRVAPDIEARVRVPLLHIADPTAEAIKAAGISTVGLLGTRFTMEQDFYRGRLERKFGLTVHVPEPASRELIHQVIYQELCRGVISEPSRASLQRVVAGLAGMGAEAVILGCTEIGLLLRDEDVSIPLFDTTLLHAEEAASFALAGH
ncbi:MAG: aspartate/glutamate racemase family protein [Deltaproteobacteria bacterium]|nr:aspartate/glutamate racemase family protein [Deltaproteobacteria bacterium]